MHLDFALARLAGVIDKLVVYPDNMRSNLDRLGGLIHSQRVLLALTQKGMSREEAYDAVQRNAMPVWRGEGDFPTLLKADPEVKAPPAFAAGTRGAIRPRLSHVTRPARSSERVCSVPGIAALIGECVIRVLSMPYVSTSR